MPAEIEGQPPASAPVEVREPASPEEFARCNELYSRTLRGPWIPESGRVDQHAIHLGAWVGDLLVGVGNLRLNSKVEGQIRWMAVDEEHRHKGVGRAILGELERLAKDRGAVRVVLRTGEGTLGFYIMRGYEVRRPPSVLFDSVQHWDMKKDLG